MKSRSHRLSVSEPHDDWVDGSWTVDCVCGVNFDDGEEMVNCDECGVWVHTSCSRYVKSQKSFACDKCNSKNNGDSGIGNDSEETEVAEFLLELPTKTLRMGLPNTASVSYGKQARLWTDIPMEDRVHVQGVPGGEPGLFSGIKMLSILGPELWKSTGHVPKKFKYRLSEFSCSTDSNIEEKKEALINRENVEGHASQADSEAGVLLSLSKEKNNTLSIPTGDASGVKSTIEGGGCQGLVFPKQRKKLDVKNPDFTNPDDSIKERLTVQPILLHCSKFKTETSGILKDQSAKKKGKTQDKEGNVKMQSPRVSKEASTFSTNSKVSEFSQDGGFKAVSDDTQCDRDALDDRTSDDRTPDNLGECATNLASNHPHCPETTLRNGISSDGLSKEGNEDVQVSSRSESLCKSSNGVPLVTGLDGSSPPVKVEVQDVPQSLDVRVGSGVGFGLHDPNPLVVDASSAGRKHKESESGQNLNADETRSWTKKKLKREKDSDDSGGLVPILPLDAVKLNAIKPAANQHLESSANLSSENCKVNMTSVLCSESSDLNVHDNNSRSLIAGTSRTDKSDVSLGVSYSNLESTGSEGFLEAKTRSSELPYSPAVRKEMVKPTEAVSNHLTSSQGKVMVSARKSPSISTGAVSKFSDNHMAPTAQNPTIGSNRSKELSETSSETAKDNSSTHKILDDGKYVRSKKFVKEPSRLTSVSEKSQSTKLSHDLESRRPSSDAKDFVMHNTSKLPLVSNLNAASGSGEYANSSQGGEASNVRNKASGLIVTGKDDKYHHSAKHGSSSGNVASMTAPFANVPAGLSDEELALLLHQELNSSPRVPRVPRMRHTGSLPQLGFPTASSTLMKRTSSSGGKDHSISSRRNTKDLSRDGSRRLMERDNEAKRMNRKPFSADSRRREPNGNIDRLPRRETNDGIVKDLHSVKKTNGNGSLSSSGDGNGCNASSSHPSSRNSSDDSARIFSHTSSRTLPGLIADIMSEGKRMTYEELCNAVLPHWPHLRKHNGERYAYSSHSQAVLDCLRNRSEWSRLVDRGPKTSGSRKRRKLDTDSVSVESDGNEDIGYRHSKDVGSKSFESQQEDFPKGKRNARKRTRVTSQGRNVVQRRRRADVVSDDESESYSDSSEDSISSEEEIQGGGTSGVGNEGSSSSEEVL